MEGRLTLCNLSIEMGARGGIVAPDEVTMAYVKGRDFAPTGDAWDRAVAYWQTLKSDDDAVFDREYRFDAACIEPRITINQNEPKDIALRVSHTQARYLRALPLHHTQSEEVHDTYSIFRYRMLLTYDLYEKILSLGSNVEVLTPPELKSQTPPNSPLFPPISATKKKFFWRLTPPKSRQNPTKSENEKK